ncbi:hypothetical protein F4804DRAFT_336911 [Jackrogersella minutella]|nr:hypothetical protein F4804DRAFT_336911 [Jackrogersella minutella]
MSTPTLPASWAPTQQGCLRTDDYWIWDNGVVLDQRTVLGGPSQISGCLPSTWGGTVTYAGSECPSQYTSACQGTTFAAVVTCCPTAYAFSCESGYLTDHHSVDFRCLSQHSHSDTMVVTQTDLQLNTIAIQTRVKDTNRHLYALAILYTTVISPSLDTVITLFLIARKAPTTTTSSTISTITPTSTPTEDSVTAETSTQPSSTTLSPGQAAGIGIGAAFAVLILASIVAFILWRRRKAFKSVEQVSNVVQYIDSLPRPRTPVTMVFLPSTFFAQAAVSEYLWICSDMVWRHGIRKKRSEDMAPLVT